MSFENASLEALEKSLFGSDEESLDGLKGWTDQLIKFFKFKDDLKDVLLIKV